VKIGLFGGTFNPIHLGHVKCAEEILRQFQLDKILFIPARTPVHKELDSEVDAADRIKMIELAIQGYNQFEVSTIEIDRSEASYSIITIESIQSKYPAAQIYFILGVDSFNTLRSWERSEKLMKSVSFILMKRPGEAPEADLLKSAHKVLCAENNEYQISSSEIRERVKMQLNIDKLVDQRVAAYIKDKEIYL
jgi:nicotinate-nucleotide adenylyltransferase